MPLRVLADAAEAQAEIGESFSRLSSGPVLARVSRWRLMAGLQVAEMVAVAAAAGHWLSDGVAEGSGRAGVLALLGSAAAVSAVVHFVLRSMGAYDFAAVLAVWRSALKAAGAWLLATAPLLAWSVTLQAPARLWQHSVPDWLAGVALVVLVRLGAGSVGAAMLLTRRVSHSVVVVGRGAEAQACLHRLRADPSAASAVGFVSGHDDGAAAGLTGRWLASVQHLVQSHHVSEVIVATSQEDNRHIPALVRGLLCLPVRVLVWPQSIGVEPGWLATSAYRLGDMPLLAVSAPPLDGWHWVLKDMQDRLLALVLLIVCSPALIGIAALIRLSSPGPVLFRQEREGYNGGRFVIFKFRTMSSAPAGTDGLVLTARDDTRVFPLGRFLRRTSLDELPQLLNVICGDMWLVGPRPHSPLATVGGQRYAAAAQHYMARFRVKPGMTGWAQVHGWRGSTDTIEQIQQRVVHDLYYIDNWSVWLDFRILLRTAVKGFVHQNAY